MHPEPAAALAESVSAHLVADVPVALFLSSGIDSGLVAALACRALPAPPVAFTVTFEGWEGQARDEAPLARTVARGLGSATSSAASAGRRWPAHWEAALAAMDQPRSTVSTPPRRAPRL